MTAAQQRNVVQVMRPAHGIVIREEQRRRSDQSSDSLGDRVFEVVVEIGESVRKASPVAKTT
jgi:hypothetical protein